MSRRIRTLSENDREACLSVLKQHGYRSYFHAEQTLDFTVGTFRDRISASSNENVPIVDIVTSLIANGVRKTHRFGGVSRNVIEDKIRESGKISCRTCGETRDFQHFKPSTKSLAGRHQRCCDCEAIYERCRRTNLTRQEILDLWNFQRGGCGICSKQLKSEYMNVQGHMFEAPSMELDTAHIDHDHNYKHSKLSTRGLLCSDCNRGLKEHIAADPKRWVNAALLWLPQRNVNWPALGLLPNQRSIGGALAHKEWLHYGITPEDRQKLRIQQSSLCGICDTPLVPGRQEHLDHDESDHSWPHTIENTSKQRAQIRGLLCAGCNTALPRFRHDPKILKLIPDYLQNPPAHTLWPRPTPSPPSPSSSNTARS